MVKKGKKIEVDRSVFKCDYIRNTPTSLFKADTTNLPIFTYIWREDSVISLKDIIIELDYTLTENSNNHADYVHADEKRLFKSAPNVLFSLSNWITSTGKVLERINYAHVVC